MLRRLREWYDGPKLPLSITALVLAGFGAGEGWRLYTSPLWGSTRFLHGVLTGAAAALPWAVMLVVYAVRHRLGMDGKDGLVAGPVAFGLAVGYTAAVVAALGLVHSRFNPQPQIDSTYRVAALAFLVALDASVVAVTTWIVLFVRDP
jgi:hypothetical protein